MANGEVDINGIGVRAVLTAQTFKGSYSIGADHRGVMTMVIPGGAKLAFAMMANGNAQFIEVDAGGGTGTSGSGTIEKVDASAYNSANITGNYAFGVAGMDANNNRAALLGRFTSNGAELGSCNVASNGRTSILARGAAGVAYLTGMNSAFILGSDSSVLFGFGESQAAASFTNGQMQGAYAGLATSPVTFSVTAFSGEFSTDGASPTGNITGLEDIGAPSGSLSGVAFKATYSLPSSGTTGRGTITVTSKPGGNAIVYLISSSKFVAASMADRNPAVMIFEQAPLN